MAVPPLSAVLFDLDGTLIESDTVWDDAVVELAAGRDAVIPRDVLALTQGLCSQDAMTLVHTHLAWDGRDVAADVAWVEARVRDIYLDRVQWRPGALALVRLVRSAGIPTGLVTSTNRPLVDLLLDTVGRENFDVTVCGDDVRRPKPHPEPYLTAAARLGVPPASCVAIEDSLPGAASARAADCRVVLVGGLSSADGDLTVDSLVDVRVDMLAALCRPVGGEAPL